MGTSGTIGNLPIYEAGDPASSPVIVIEEVFGLNDHIKDVTDRLGRERFRAVAPELLYRKPPPKAFASVEEIIGFISEVPDEQVMTDLRAVVDHVGACGVIGFCVGGVWALMLGCVEPRIRAVVDFYGRVRYPKTTPHKPISPIDRVKSLHAPALCLFGERDPGIPMTDVKALESELAKWGKTSEIRSYAEAAHGFFNDTRGSYHPASAADAWRRALAWLRRYLKS